jgi:hypothetical protein
MTRIVPETPTPEMLEAGRRTRRINIMNSATDELEPIYTAMI